MQISKYYGLRLGTVLLPQIACAFLLSRLRGCAPKSLGQSMARMGTDTPGHSIHLIVSLWPFTLYPETFHARQVPVQSVYVRYESSLFPTCCKVSCAASIVEGNMAPRNVYQFKISLRGSWPRIWRRIQVPTTYTFKNIHSVIQKVMGWRSCHMYEFETTEPECTIGPKIDGIHDDMLPDDQEKISKYLKAPGDACLYTYDMGDSWEHVVELEKIVPRADGAYYPRCIAGKHQGPPENCGGVWGYKHVRKVMRDPDDPEHDMLKSWMEDLDYELDPPGFDCTKLL